MAEIDGMPIAGESGSRAWGGAFTLSAASPASEVVELDLGWIVEVRRGSRVSVARGPSEGQYGETRAEALRRAHQGLDLLCMKGIADLQIVRASEEHLTWWTAREGIVLRATSVGTLTASVPPVKVVVTDPLGNIKPDPPPPQLLWHESFTYFRLAQVTDDLFDAFRNLYLAVESILSTIEPMGPKESEAIWLEKALRAAAKLTSLAAFAPRGDADPPGTISNDLRQTRNAVFHAKSNRPHFAPHGWSDRASVLEKLKQMARMYLRLVEVQLGFARPSSGFFASGIRLLTKHLDEHLVIHVTDDVTPFDPADTTVNPGGGHVVSLPTRPAPELDQPFLRSFIGRASVTELSDLTHISRIASTYNGQPMTAGILEGRLTLAGIDYFEGHMGIQFRNKQQPRYLYDA